MIVEIRGELKLRGSGADVQTLPLEVKAELSYEERTLDWDTSGHPTYAARQYHQAQAEIKVGGNTDQPELSSEHQLLIVDTAGIAQQLRCPTSPLSRDELELIDVPASSSLVSRLLPQEPVSIGDTWQHDDELLAALLNIDAVTESDVSSTLKSIEGSEARCEVSGTISGGADGVETEIEIRGRYTFDLDAKQMTWVAMLINENRSIGHATPGYEVQARVRMLLTPLAESVMLGDEVVATLQESDSSVANMLSYRSTNGGFLITYDRRWRVMIDNSTLTVLRLVDRGELLAQCNIVRLPDFEPGRQKPVEEFQQDVREALGDKFGEMVAASDEVTPDGLQIVRVTVAGTVQDLPIEWIYYHLVDQQGRRATCVFTFDSNEAEQFAAADEALTSSFRFLASVEGEAAAPAETAPQASQEESAADTADATESLLH